MLSRKLIASGIVLTSLLSQGSISEKTYDSTFSQKIAQNSKVSIINWEPYDLNFDENQIIATYWSYEQHKLILKNYPIKGWEISIQRDDKNKTEIFDFEMDYNTKIQILEIYQQNQKKDRLYLKNFPTKGWRLFLKDQDKNGIPDHLDLSFPEEETYFLKRQLEMKLSEEAV